MKVVEPGSCKSWVGNTGRGHKELAQNPITSPLSHCACSLSSNPLVTWDSFCERRKKNYELGLYKPGVLYEPEMDGGCVTVPYRVVLKDSRDGKSSQWAQLPAV